MHIVIEELEGALIIEAVLSPQEIFRIGNREMIEGETIYKRRKCTVSVRLPSAWDYFEENEPEGE